jgi:hypothetical protein
MHSISIAVEIHRPSFFACVRMQVLRKQANLSAIRFPFSVLWYELRASARKIRPNPGRGVRVSRN